MLDSQTLTLQQTLDVLAADLQLQQPSVSTADGRVLFLQSLRSNYEENLQQKLVALCQGQSRQQQPSTEPQQLRLVLNDRGGSSAHVIVVYGGREAADQQPAQRDTD